MPMDRYFFSIGGTRRILEGGGWREREREGGEAGSISERGELELKLSPAVDTVSGQILFFSERRQMFGYQVRNRSLLLLFFFDRGWKMVVQPEFFEKEEFSYFVALLFFERAGKGRDFSCTCGSCDE